MSFPSPCGDMVLKLLNPTSLERTFSQVSVPLRGYGFEIMFGMVVMSLPMVSVPLRGYGFEMITWTTDSTLWTTCFRPLAGIWF